MNPITVSIIINNYNYAEYLREAIDSALAQTYENVEVIVVDDGSTDDSREIIASYGDAIVVVLQENAGQVSAMNVGFEISTGEAVLFLDSDDRLSKKCMESVLSHWEEGDCLLLFQMRIIDKDGNESGLIHPLDRQMPRGNARDQVLRHGNYPAPPTSGLVFSKKALLKVFPIEIHQMNCTVDSLLRTLVPFLGGSRFLHVVLGDYRIHGSNMSVTMSRAIKIQRMLKSNLIKQAHLEALGVREGFDVPPGLFRGNLQDIKGRLASLRLDKGEHPFPDESRFKLWKAGVLYCVCTPALGLGKRCTTAGWFSATAWLPLFLARPIIELAYRETTLQLNVKGQRAGVSTS